MSNIETQTQPASLDDLPLTLRVEQVAGVLQVDKSTVYAMINRGDLPVIKAGRVFRVSRAVVERLLDGAAR